MRYLLIAVSDPQAIDIIRRDSSVTVDVLCESDSLLTISAHAVITSDEGRAITQTVRQTRRDVPRKPVMHPPGYSCCVCGKALLPGLPCHRECEPEYYGSARRTTASKN